MRARACVLHHSSNLIPGKQVKSIQHVAHVSTEMLASFQHYYRIEPCYFCMSIFNVLVETPSGASHFLETYMVFQAVLRLLPFLLVLT